MKWMFAIIALSTFAYADDPSDEVRQFAHSVLRDLDADIAVTRQAFQAGDISKTELASANLEYYRARLAVARIDAPSDSQDARRSAPSTDIEETLGQIVVMQQILFDDVVGRQETGPRETFEATLALRQAQIAYLSYRTASSDKDKSAEILQKIIHGEYAELIALQGAAGEQDANAKATIFYKRLLITHLCSLSPER